jgi:hypothetical protein
MLLEKMYTRWLTCRLIFFAVIAQTFLVEKEKEGSLTKWRCRKIETLLLRLVPYFVIFIRQRWRQYYKRPKLEMLDRTRARRQTIIRPKSIEIIFGTTNNRTGSSGIPFSFSIPMENHQRVGSLAITDIFFTTEIDLVSSASIECPTNRTSHSYCQFKPAPAVSAERNTNKQMYV